MSFRNTTHSQPAGKETKSEYQTNAKKPFDFVEGVTIFLPKMPETPEDFYKLAVALFEQTSYYHCPYEEIYLWLTFNKAPWDPVDKELNILRLAYGFMRKAAESNYSDAKQCRDYIAKYIKDYLNPPDKKAEKEVTKPAEKPQDKEGSVAKLVTIKPVPLHEHSTFRPKPTVVPKNTDKPAKNHSAETIEMYGVSWHL